MVNKIREVLKERSIAIKGYITEVLAAIRAISFVIRSIKRTSTGGAISANLYTAVKGKYYKLKKDIVIPAGAVFYTSAEVTVRNTNGALLDTIIGLSPNTAGTFEYTCGDKEVEEYFEEMNT